MLLVRRRWGMGCAPPAGGVGGGHRTAALGDREAAMAERKWLPNWRPNVTVEVARMLDSAWR